MQFLKSLEVRVRRLRNQFIAPLRYGGDAVFCPTCEQGFSTFLPAGTGERARPNAVCPGCRCRERDRLNWLYLQKNASELLFRHMQFLHIAPEPELGAYLEGEIGEGYITADLMRKDVMVRMDVQAIQYPNETMDALYCSHVLQDVPDDTAAIAEFYRILKPGGWAILNVPLFEEKTSESTKPDNVRASWDQRPDEHVRHYGHDYKLRLEDAGFEVDVSSAEDLEPDAKMRGRYGIDGARTGFIHFARKAPNS
ncbi:MAG: methyltransferase domain-containing protein [Pseudomonadota bacterium]